MKKFRCDRFEILYEAHCQMGMNIRIIGFNEEMSAATGFDRSFCITEGYSGDVSLEVKKLVINFCPFCGINLRQFYTDQFYVHEYVKKIL